MAGSWTYRRDLVVNRIRATARVDAMAMQKPKLKISRGAAVSQGTALVVGVEATAEPPAVSMALIRSKDIVHSEAMSSHNKF